MPEPTRIKPKDRDLILQALRAGVVPRLGLQHIQVGRAREVEEMVRDVERIGQGGAAIRFVIGEYGTGKTFFLNLARLIALEKKLVVINADLAPDRRLHASGGQARSLYSELLRNMATRTRPEGGALASVVERFIGDVHKDAKAGGHSVEDLVQERLAPLQDLVAGYDFTTVLTHYWRASEDGNEPGKAAALCWLRAEYSTRTEARQALGVRDIIDDASFYDYLKLLARFVTIAGYDGLLVVLDEMVNLYKLTSVQARSSNYEQILRILNDVLQGSAENVGFLLGGTPEFLMDPRRGLYSYPALQSRLAENRFVRDGLVDLSGPVIRLQNLMPEDLYVLLRNLRHVHAGGDPARHAVPDEALTAFMNHCSSRIGDAYFRTPRNTVTEFVSLLSVLEQNPGTPWQSLLGTIMPAIDVPPPDTIPDGDDDDLTSFKL
ncbi:MAG: ATP-binding protein [Azospirillaceae bacterium]|nr:ATP-binding protein [Azospirillaceae bacterium]